jgi:hypothetical protein
MVCRYLQVGLVVFVCTYVHIYLKLFKAVPLEISLFQSQRPDNTSLAQQYPDKAAAMPHFFNVFI